MVNAVDERRRAATGWANQFFIDRENTMIVSDTCYQDWVRPTTLPKNRNDTLGRYWGYQIAWKWCSECHWLKSTRSSIWHFKKSVLWGSREADFLTKKHQNYKHRSRQGFLVQLGNCPDDCDRASESIHHDIIYNYKFPLFRYFFKTYINAWGIF